MALLSTLVLNVAIWNEVLPRPAVAMISIGLLYAHRLKIASVEPGGFSVRSAELAVILLR